MKPKSKTYGHIFVLILVALCIITLAMNTALGIGFWTLSKIPLLLTHVILIAVPVKAYIDEYNEEGPFEDNKFFKRCLLYCAVAALCVYLAGVVASFMAPNFARKLRHDTFGSILGLAFVTVIAKLIIAELTKNRKNT